MSSVPVAYLGLRIGSAFGGQGLPIDDNFVNQFAQAFLAFLCICFVAVFAVAIGTHWIQRRSPLGQQFLGVWHIWFWILAIATLLIYWLLVIASLAIDEGGVLSGDAYRALTCIAHFFSFITTVAILAVIYHVQEKCSQGSVSADTTRAKVKAWTRHGLAAVLGLLAFVDWCLYLGFRTRGTSVSIYDNVFNSYAKLLVAWSAIYLAAALGILVSSIISLVREGPSNRQLHVLFLTLISIPLVIHSIFSLVVVVLYTLPHPRLLSMLNYNLALDIVFELVPYTLLFIGVFVVGLRWKKLSLAGRLAHEPVGPRDPLQPEFGATVPVEKAAAADTAAGPAPPKANEFGPATAALGPNAHELDQNKTPAGPGAHELGQGNTAAAPNAHELGQPTAPVPPGLPEAPAGTRWVLEPVRPQYELPATQPAQ